MTALIFTAWGRAWSWREGQLPPTALQVYGRQRYHWIFFFFFFYLQSTSLLAQHSEGTQILPEVFWFCFAFTKPFLCSQCLLNKPLVNFCYWQPWLRALLLLILGWKLQGLSMDGEIQPAQNGVVPSSSLVHKWSSDTWRDYLKDSSFSCS